MMRRPPRCTRTDPRLPYTLLFLSAAPRNDGQADVADEADQGLGRGLAVLGIDLHGLAGVEGGAAHHAQLLACGGNIHVRRIVVALDAVEVVLEIGRATCRVRVGQSVELSVVAVLSKLTHKLDVISTKPV